MPQAVAAVFTTIGNYLSSSAFVQAVAVAAVSTGINAVVTNNNKPKEQGGLIQLQLDPSAPRRLIIGKRATGGVLVDWFLAGGNNGKIYMPIYISEGPCNRITRVFVGGREVYSTPLAHGVKTEIEGFRSGGPRLWLTWYDGRVGQTADSTLVGLSQGWTAANKLSRCAWVMVEAWWDSDNLRAPPALTFEVEGAKLYDRRKDTTAGGSGAHRFNDPATWEYTANPAVALDHYRMGWYAGDVKVLGPGEAAGNWPYASFAAQANLSDEDVDLKAGGTQKRYRANGFIFANDDRATIITKLAGAMAARPADYGGRFGVVGPEARTPVLSIDDLDLTETSVETYTPKRSWAQLVTAVEGRYQDPNQLYQPVDFPRVTDAAWEAEDGGEGRTVSLPLEFEIDVERAQRLATLHARSERRQATLEGIYPAWAVELERGDWFTRTGARWGDGKDFEVMERVYNPATHTVQIVAREVDPADSAWDESVAQDGPPAPLDSTDELAAVQVPSLTVTASTVAGSASETPSLTVSWAAVTDSRVRSVFVEVLRVSDGARVASQSVSLPDDDNTVIVQNGIADGVQYDVRARFVTTTLLSEWSAAVRRTTGATYAVGTAVSVPWSGVTGSGKPEDNADVTAANTAAAISGQGALATLSSLAYGSAQLTGFGSLAALAWATLGTNIRRADGTTVVSEALVVTSLGTASAISGQGGLATQSWVTIGTNLRRADGTTVANEALVVTSLGTASAISGQGALATQSNVAYATQVTGLPNAIQPANMNNGEISATYVAVHGVATLANRWPAELGANVTETRTAASISGQGGLATLTWVTIGTNLRLANGTTIATEATLVTAQGVASAIAGQGALATVSAAAWGSQVSGRPSNLAGLGGSEPLDNRAATGNANRVRFGTWPGAQAFGWSAFDAWGSTSGVGGGVNISGQWVGPDNYFWATAAGTVGTGQRFVIRSGAQTASPVVPGERIIVSIYVAGDRTGELVGEVEWFDVSANSIGWTAIQTVAVGSYARNIGGSACDRKSNMTRLSGVITVPATVSGIRPAFAGWFVSFKGNGEADPYGFVNGPMIESARDLQTAPSGYVPGPDAYERADRTAINIAASISGQGALATVSTANGYAYATPVRDGLQTPGTTYAEVVSRSISVDGGVVDIDFDALFEVGDANFPVSPPEPQIVYGKLKRGSTTLLNDVKLCSFAAMEDARMALPGRMSYLDTPGAGTHTYSVEIKTSLNRSSGLKTCKILDGARFRLINPKTGANSVVS